MFLNKFECVLKFMVKEDNEDVEFDDGEEDEYTLNNMTMRHRDGRRRAVDREAQGPLGPIGCEQESRKKGKLNFSALQPALDHVVRAAGLTPVKNSHRLDDDGALQHGILCRAWQPEPEPESGKASCGMQGGASVSQDGRGGGVGVAQGVLVPEHGGALSVEVALQSHMEDSLCLDLRTPTTRAPPSTWWSARRPTRTSCSCSACATCSRRWTCCPHTAAS